MSDAAASGLPEIEFCPPRTRVPAELPAGVLYLFARDGQEEPLARAEWTIGRRLEGWPRGAGPVTRIVVRLEPTLDDMLAAMFVQALVSDRKIPDGAAQFAKYAGMAREGHRPAPKQALECSLEGVFLAIRREAGEKLDSPDVARRFLAGWERLGGAIQRAAADGRDPFQESPCDELLDKGLFAKERVYLARDRDLYQQDVARGERWRTRLPIADAPAETAALVLRRPKSLLFRYWCREDEAAPGGHGYHLLVVEKHVEPKWMISTEPVQRLSIESLAVPLQAAELKANPNAADDAWYDGRRHQHTVVASPNAGTRLSDDEVLRVVRGWCQATPVRSDGLPRNPRIGRRAALMAAGAACLGAVGMGAWMLRPREETVWVDRGMQFDVEETERGLPAPDRPGRDYALLIATNEYEHWKDLDNPLPDARAIGDELRQRYGVETLPIVSPRNDEELIQSVAQFQDAARFSEQDRLLIFIAGHGDYDATTKRGFIVTATSRAQGTTSPGTAYLPLAELKEVVSNLPQKHILLMLDVCYGGSIDREIALGKKLVYERAAGGGYQRVGKAEYVSRLLERPTRMCITSGRCKPVPDGWDGKHSPFAAQMLAALRTNGGDEGILSAEEIWKEVAKTMTEPWRGVLDGHEGGDFLLICQESAPLPPTP